MYHHSIFVALQIDVGKGQGPRCVILCVCDDGGGGVVLIGLKMAKHFVRVFPPVAPPLPGYSQYSIWHRSSVVF